MGTQILLDDGTVAQGIVPLTKSGLPISPLAPMPIIGTAARATVAATIANGAALSDAVDLSNTALVGFVAPAAWTAATLTIEASTDGTTWITAGLLDLSGSPVSSWPSVTVGAGYSVDPVAMLPWRYVRFKSSVNQGAARVFVVISRPLA